jgi:hypothetical protein
MWILTGCLSLAAPAQAFSCLFDTECLETNGCHETEFLMDVLAGDTAASTNFGELDIVAINQGENLVTLYARRRGTHYMITVTPDGARMSAQVHDGPLVFSYLGQCEGVF